MATIYQTRREKIMEKETENYGLVDCHSDKRYFSAVRPLDDGRSEVTLVTGKAMIVADVDILRWPKSGGNKDSHSDDRALINRPGEKPDKVQSERRAPEAKPIESEVPEPPADWLRGCEICNTGLCRKMDELTASSKKGAVGLPIREAAKRLEEQAEKEIGEKVWTAEQIRARYLYHIGKMVPGRNSTTPKKVISPGATEQVCPPPDPPGQESIDATSNDVPPSSVPLFERDKEAFLNFIKRIHREWREGMGLIEEDMETDSLVIGYMVFPVSDEKREIRRPSIQVRKERFERMMKNYPEPIEVRILNALANLGEDMNLYLCEIPVPDEVYEKVKRPKEKKSAPRVKQPGKRR
jgi:hypothetical protein